MNWPKPCGKAAGSGHQSPSPPVSSARPVNQPSSTTNSSAPMCAPVWPPDAATGFGLRGYVPVAGPGEGDAVRRRCLAVLHREPGRVCVTGYALEAADGERASGQVELGALELLRPLAGEVRQAGD